MYETHRREDKCERNHRKRGVLVWERNLEEEKREAARQARKLEFLISQTELYSHFVGNKLKSKQACQDFLIAVSNNDSY